METVAYYVIDYIFKYSTWLFFELFLKQVAGQPYELMRKEVSSTKYSNDVVTYQLGCNQSGNVKGFE